MTSITVDGWCVEGPELLLAVDDQAIFVIDRYEQLLRIDKATPFPWVLNGSPEDPPAYPVAADGGMELFFASCVVGPQGCPIYAVSRSGGPVRKVADPPPQAHDYDRPEAMTTDAKYVYWLNSSIWRAPRDGSGSPEQIGSGLGQTGMFGGLATDDSALYATLGTLNVVERIPFDGSPMTVVSSRNTPTSIITAGGTIYWMELGTLGVDCTPMGGAIESWTGVGDPTPLATGLYGVSGVASIAGNLYWSTVGPMCNWTQAVGEVTELPAGATTPSTLAMNQLNSRNILSDGLYLYWAVDGAIVRAPLP